MALAEEISGEWEMDLSASDNISPLLRELGLNAILSAVVARLSVRQSISVSTDAINIHVKTRVSKDTLVLPLDGTPVAVPGLSGGQAAAVSGWLDDECTQFCTRQSLCQVQDSNVAAAAADLAKEAFVTLRFLRGATLIESNTIVRGGVELAEPRAERVLRRVAG